MKFGYRAMQQLLLSVMISVVVLIGAGLNAEVTEAANYYVATNGSDSNPGTQTQPFRTIQRAANQVVAGDTVLIRSGTYSEFSVPASGTAASRITFKNYPGETVTVQASSNTVMGVLIYGKSYIMIDGLKVSGGDIGILVGYGSSNNQILNCEVTLSKRNGIAIFNQSNNNAVKGCRVYDNARENWPRGSAEIWAGGLAVFSASLNNIIEDNYVYWNHGEGISAWEGADGTIIRRNVSADNWSANIYANGSRNVTIQDNFAYLTNEAKNWPYGAAQNNNSCGICISVEPSMIDPAITRGITGLKVFNNIVVNAGYGIIAFPEDTGFLFTSWLIANNTLVNNDIGIWLKDSPGDVIQGNTIRNNIVVQNRGGYVWVLDPPGPNTLSNNLYFGSAQSFVWGTTNTGFAGWRNLSGEVSSLWSDPKLIAPLAIPPRFWSDSTLSPPSPILPLGTLTGNYKLTAISPARDVGTTILGLSTDILGTARPQGQAWDIGAYEFPIGSQPPSPPSNLLVNPQ